MSSRGCRRSCLLVGLSMDREVGRGFVRRGVVGVERRRVRGSVLGRGRGRRRVVGDFEGGKVLVRSLVRGDRRCCLDCKEVVGGMVEEVVQNHRVDGVGRGFHLRRSLGWTFLFDLLLLCWDYLLFSCWIVFGLMYLKMFVSPLEIEQETMRSLLNMSRKRRQVG